MAGEGMDVIGVYHMTADELLRVHKVRQIYQIVKQEHNDRPCPKPDIRSFDQEKYPDLLVTVAFFELYGGQVFVSRKHIFYANQYRR